VFDANIPAGGIKRHAGQSSCQLDLDKSSRANCGFAFVQNHSAEALPRPIWMDKECADPRGLTGRIELSVIAGRMMITPEKSFAFAPSAAGDNRGRNSATPLDPTRLAGARLPSFKDKVGAIADQLAVDTKNRADRRLHLRP